MKPLEVIRDEVRQIYVEAFTRAERDLLRRSRESYSDAYPDSGPEYDVPRELRYRDQRIRGSIQEAAEDGFDDAIGFRQEAS